MWSHFQTTSPCMSDPGKQITHLKHVREVINTKYLLYESESECMFTVVDVVFPQWKTQIHPEALPLSDSMRILINANYRGQTNNSDIFMGTENKAALDFFFRSQLAYFHLCAGNRRLWEPQIISVYFLPCNWGIFVLSETNVTFDLCVLIQEPGASAAEILIV